MEYGGAKRRMPTKQNPLNVFLTVPFSPLIRSLCNRPWWLSGLRRWAMFTQALSLGPGFESRLGRNYMEKLYCCLRHPLEIGFRYNYPMNKKLCSQVKSGIRELWNFISPIQINWILTMASFLISNVVFDIIFIPHN